VIEAGNKPLIGSDRALPKPGGFGRAETSPGPFEERHYSVAEIGELWSLSTDVVRQLFEREAGVIVIGDPAPRGKRRYTTLRIPQSVLERVHRRLRNP
jgi:hypothetical protein